MTAGNERDTGTVGLRERLEHAVDLAVSVQQPAVERHVRRLRERYPDEGPAEVIARLERQYLTAVTSAGAAVGGAAAAPGVGTGLAAVLSAGETVGSLEASALLALAVAHVHDIHVQDVERRRTLLLAVLFGDRGARLVEKAAGRTGRHWGKLLTDKLSSSTISSVNRVLGRWFVTRYGTKQGVIVVGRLAPFGIGAVIGGGGNALLGRSVVAGVRRAFGPAPERWADSPAVIIASAQRLTGRPETTD